MKKINITTYFVLIFCLALTSCVDTFKTVIDEELPDFEPVLVFNGVLAGRDSVTKANLSENKSILDDNGGNYDGDSEKADADLIKNAKISFYEDAKLVGVYQPIVIEKNDEEPYDYYYKPRNNYYFNHQPKAGSTYKVVAEKEGYNTVESSFQMPKIDADLTIKNIISSSGDDPNSNKVKLTYTIKDKSGKDFYRLTIYNKMVGFEGEIYINEVYYSEQVENDFFETGESDITLFSDELFSEKTREKTIFFNSYYNIEESDSSEFIVELSSFSEGYFKYLKSQNIAFDAEDNPLAQPVQVYSNIENGLGIFGGVVSKQKAFKIAAPKVN